MSSRFPDFFVAPKAGNVKTWMVQVNNLGDAVVYCLDGEGKPSNMACGPVVDTILDSLACAIPNVIVHVLDRPDCPNYYGFRVNTWSELVDVLAGRSHHSWRAETRRIWHHQIGAKYTPLRRYVVGTSWRYSELRITDDARAADGRFLANLEKNNRHMAGD